MDTQTKLSKARTALLLDRRYVFWATIGMYQELKELPDDHPLWPRFADQQGKEVVNNTMATDGDNLYFSKSFVDGLSHRELMFVLAHEAGHCALKHIFRRGIRDPRAWNFACDLALNPMLKETNLTPPKNVLMDERFKGMYAEQIYNKFRIIEIPAGCWDVGSVIDAAREQDGEGEKKWEIRIRQAAQNAKGQGHLPGGFEELLKPMTPKVDLHSMLRHMIALCTREDFTWARVNKKHIHRGMYLPAERTESAGDVLVGIDTSGSVDSNMLAKFIGIVNVVISDLKPRTVHLVQCDAALNKHDEYHQGNPLPTKFAVKGRGGTCMRPIWEYVKKKNLNVACGIVCSDFLMGQEDFGDPQKFPVLWVTVDKALKAPWGETARIIDED